MNAPYSMIRRIVKEELYQHIKSLVEATKVVDGGEDKLEKEKDKHERGEGKAIAPQKGNMHVPVPQKDLSNKKSPNEDLNGKVPAKKPAKGSAPEELPADDKESIETNDDVPDANKPEIEAEPEIAATDKEKNKDSLSNELSNKIIQSITFEPKSKIIPGAQEVVLTFGDTPDPFKILIQKTGKIAYYYRGLRNTL